MNRERKFRVWSNVKNDWVQNMLLLACIDGLPFAHFVELDDEKNLVKHHIYNASNLELTIQDYTGLKDKNGKEIFEGDILQHDFPRNGHNIVEVKWISEEDEWDYTGWMLTNNYSQGGSREIIGNIFENPELLKN